MTKKKISEPYLLDLSEMGEVMALEKECFEYHWTEEQFRLGLERNAYSIFGWREPDRLVGYLAFSMIADEMEILNLAVSPKFRCRGIGGKLLSSLLGLCVNKNMKSGFLDVKRSNIAAITLYEKKGFFQIGVRKRYYPDTKEDALLYRIDF